MQQGLLKKFIGENIYDKLLDKKGIVLDKDGNVTEFRIQKKNEDPLKKTKIKLLDDDERKKLNFDIKELFFLPSGSCKLPNLTAIDLNEADNVKGDIKVLNSLSNLTEINLGYTDVVGEIAALNSLSNLTEINLELTDVEGNIQDLALFPKLTKISLSACEEFDGDIADLKLLQNLDNMTEIDLSETGVTGEKADVPKQIVGKINIKDTPANG